MEEFVGPISWAVVMLLLFVGPRLPGGLYFWTGIVFITVGISALASPGANWLFQMSFAVIYLVGRHLVRTKIRAKLSGDTATYDTKGSNRDKLVGKIATVTKAIRAGSGIGMVTIKNDPWRVRSKEEIPEGSKVRVVGTEGEFLMVARAE